MKYRWNERTIGYTVMADRHTDRQTDRQTSKCITVRPRSSIWPLLKTVTVGN